MPSQKPTREERKFSRKFVRAVRRHYRRKLKRQLHHMQGARLAGYKKIIRDNIHAILIEDRQQRGRPSPIMALSREHYEHVAEHIVSAALAPENNPLANSHHPAPGEVEHYTHNNPFLRFLCTCGGSFLINKIFDYLTFVPDKDKISTPYLRLNLEQEFENELEACREELKQYGYEKIVRFG